MTQSASSIYFLSLAVLATLLLWGISLWNGTVKALIVASWYGVFEDGTPFKTSYTGIFPIDFPISLLVAFFYFGTNGIDDSYQHFLIGAYSTLQSAFVWLYIESGRSCAKPFSVETPIVWGLLWQGFGAAISLPLYFYNHLLWTETKPSTLPLTPVPVAQATSVSFVLGAVFPAIIGMLPTWVERSPSRHQTILAWWQPDPLWVCIFQAAAVAVFSSSKSARSDSSKVFWARTSYLLAAASSFLGHMLMVTNILASPNPGQVFSTMFIPETYLGSHEGMKLLEGPRLFLQYDLIIISLSSISWVYVLISRLVSPEDVVNLQVLGSLLMGLVTVGPGATVSLGLFWREGELGRRGAALGTQKAK